MRDATASAHGRLVEALPADLIVRVLSLCSGTTIRALDCTANSVRALIPRGIAAIQLMSPVPLPASPLRPWAALLVLQQATTWLSREATSPTELSEALLLACGAHSEDRELYCPRPRMMVEEATPSMRQHREARQRKLLPCVLQHGIRPAVAAAALLAGALRLHPAAYDVLSAAARCIQILLQPCLDEGRSQSAQEARGHDAASAQAAADVVAGGLVAPLARSAALHEDEGVNAIASSLSLLARHGAHGALLAAGGEAERPLALLLCGLNSVGTRAPSEESSHSGARPLTRPPHPPAVLPARHLPYERTLLKTTWTKHASQPHPCACGCRDARAVRGRPRRSRFRR